MISDWFFDNVIWINTDVPTIYNALLLFLKFLMFMIFVIIDIILSPFELLLLIIRR